MFESYWWINGLLAAIAACATVLVTIKFTSLAGTTDPTKTLITQVSTAVTTLLGGLLVATKDVDETLGKRIAKEFQAKFTVEGQTTDGKVPLRRNSESLLAVFSKYAYGWIDWSAANRKERIEKLKENLDSDRLAVG